MGGMTLEPRSEESRHATIPVLLRPFLDPAHHRSLRCFLSEQVQTHPVRGNPPESGHPATRAGPIGLVVGSPTTWPLTNTRRGACLAPLALPPLPRFVECRPHAESELHDLVDVVHPRPRYLAPRAPLDLAGFVKGRPVRLDVRLVGTDVHQAVEDLCYISPQPCLEPGPLCRLQVLIECEPCDRLVDNLPDRECPAPQGNRAPDGLESCLVLRFHEPEEHEAKIFAALVIGRAQQLGVAVPPEHERTPRYADVRAVVVRLRVFEIRCRKQHVRVGVRDGLQDLSRDRRRR